MWSFGESLNKCIKDGEEGAWSHFYLLELKEGPSH